MSEEWGPWIEHDGKQIPVPVGTIGEAELRSGRVVQFVAGCGSTRGGPYERTDQTGSAWVWNSSDEPDEEVILYRVRRPRGLTILKDLLADLPETVDA